MLLFLYHSFANAHAQGYPLSPKRRLVLAIVVVCATSELLLFPVSLHSDDGVTVRTDVLALNGCQTAHIRRWRLKTNALIGFAQLLGSSMAVQATVVSTLITESLYTSRVEMVYYAFNHRHGEGGGG
eukprot:6186944-Pleurochrysis_carterae.AAC.1